jgi:hypothetical protein
MEAEATLGSFPGYKIVARIHFLNSVLLFSELEPPDSVGPKYVVPRSLLQETVYF